MFYSICDEDEWDVDCWDSGGHYTKGGECYSPANAVYFAHSIAKRIFSDVRIKYTDEAVKRFIQEACDADKCRVDSDEIDAFCEAVRQTYLAETVEEFNEALWEFINDSDFVEWNDVFSAHDLGYTCRLIEPEGWTTK